jgi:hypothetical protein
MSNVTNRDGWVDSCIQVMGDDLGNLFGLLCKEMWELCHEHDTYRALFQQSSDVLSLLNGAAPDFFGLTQTLLFNSIALRIARITDPEVSGRERQANLTLERLGSITQLPEVIEGACRVKKVAEPFRLWRHKVIAHTDLTAATIGFPPNFTGEQIDKVKAQIENCLKLVGQQYNFSVNSDGWTDVKGLIRHLRAAKPELERQRKIEDVIISGYSVD